MGNIVKLVFQAIATGSGFGKLLGEVKGINEKMPGLSKAAHIVGASFGTAGAAAGRMVTMLLQGGIWGVAAEGAKLLIDQLGLFKDRTAETKEKLDKLEEASRKFYETVNSNAQKSIAKIDEETKRRNAQLDITNRMIKAELQLQKARAISSGDTQAVESIDRKLTEADNNTALQKAQIAADAQARRTNESESKLADTLAAESKARRELEQAETALASASKPVETIMQSSAGAFVQTQTRDTTAEKAAVDAARKRLEIAKQQSAAAREQFDAEKSAHRLALDNVKALKAEQEAADAVATEKRRADWMKAAKDKVKADVDAQAAAAKVARDFAESERARKKKEADEKRHREMEALDEEVKKRNEQRKKDLQKDIEANRQRAASLEQALGDAMERVRETHDILGNAANMDQAGGVAEKRREFLTNSRFATGAADLIGSGKITKGKDGVWRANGRLSNLNQAILDRLNAEQNKKNVEKEQDKVVKKLDELIAKIEKMSTL